jgi:hypothetical protein
MLDRLLSEKVSDDEISKKIQRQEARGKRQEASKRKEEIEVCDWPPQEMRNCWLGFDFEISSCWADALFGKQTLRWNRNQIQPKE